jgi:serine/threonine-protein kinase
MTLRIGTMLGQYEILSPIGAGGMGEVYQARDTKLGRDVAIKVLPETFSQDKERVARFEREARLLASLNHPNIASIYDLEHSDGVQFLVLELVPGETLAERIARGAIPVDEALPLFKQMAEGLAAAHEKGVIHRDLKPANVKVTPEGKVKILDFGLAKAFAEEGLPPAELSQSPTMTREGTRAGVIMGTASYMSPEQARGKVVDKRADLWAFGCVLYEALAGHKAFDGETVTDVLAAIVKSDPNWNALPPPTPNVVRRLLSRCLQKDPNRRARDIADVGLEIEDALNEPSDTVTADSGVAKRKLLLWSVASLAFGTVLAGIAVWHLKRPEPGRVVRLAVTFPTNEEVALEGGGNPLALSPDGSRLVYAARGEGGHQLYLRSLGEPDAAPIPGTEDARNPFFSPDGEWMGFFAGGQLKKVAFGGGAPVTVCETEAMSVRGASWGADDQIVFSLESPSGLRRVPVGGGIPQMLTTPHSDKGEFSHRWPHVLPGGKAVIFTIETKGGFDEAQIAVQILETGERRILVDGGTDASYVSTGHLVYARAGSLLAVPFDLSRLAVTGHPVQILDDVVTNPPTGAAFYALSNDGSLAYLRGGPVSAERKLVWVDREGNAKPLSEGPGAYVAPRLSPDGSKLAVTIQASNDDVWIYDLARDTLTRLTVEASEDGWSLAWTPKGDRLTFNSDRAGGMSLFWKPVDGSGLAEQLATSEYVQFPGSWSPDGNWLVFTEGHPITKNDLWVLPNEGERKPQPWLQTPSQELVARFSPDGRSVAYISDESGRYEVYVRPFPGPGEKWQISTQGGAEPVWSRDGQELFYRNEDRLMAVDVTTQPAFRAGKPRLLFERQYYRGWADCPHYDVSTDGHRFVMIQPGQETGLRHIDVVLNWSEELKRLVPTQ